MKILRIVILCSFACLTGAFAFDDFLDRVGEALTLNAFAGRVRVQLRGMLDLEGYYRDGPAASLIFSDDDVLFNPRLILFLDAQLGSPIYVFTQARVDRGFDPTEDGAGMRLDEYAIRFSPWQDGRVNIQLGKVATVVGNWIPRHLSWDNPFVTAPLPYENLTAVWDTVVPLSTTTVLGWAHVRSYAGDFGGDPNLDKHMRQPVIWGPNYTSGVSLFGRLGKFDYAAELKNATLSSPPEYWDLTERGLEHPTFSGRLGFRPNEMLTIGFSASNGPYLQSDAEATLPRGRDIDDYREIVIGQDIGFAWHHLQVWSEFYEARFKIPNLGDLDTFVYYVETKYKFTPQLFAALRWNQQTFSDVRDRRRDLVPWGRDVWRIDSAIGYRFTAHTQLKVQYSFQHEDLGPREYGHTVALQLTTRF